MPTYRIYSQKIKSNKIKIKDFPLEERPRERLIKYGQRVLANYELLAIILDLREIMLYNYLKDCLIIIILFLFLGKQLIL